MTIMEKTLSSLVFFIGLGVIGMLIRRGKLDDILTLTYGKSEMEKKLMNMKELRKTLSFVCFCVGIVVVIVIYLL